MNPPDSHWVSQTLTPYLRYAFNHALSYDADLTPQVHRAINICMHQPSHPADSDDLLFERVCMSIEFRYKTTAPELWCLTENLENLARFLVRRAQVKGPYELLGRMNVGSGAWREYEKRRLEKLKDAAEKEKYENEHPISAPAKPEKAAPTEEQTDPRLVNAMPGQFLYADMFGELTAHEDQAYRHQNRVLKESRESWLWQVQQAAGLTLPEGMAHRIPHQWPLPPGQAQAAAYVQNLDLRPPPQHQILRSQGPIRHAPIHNGPAAGYRQHPYQLPQQQQQHSTTRTPGLTHHAPSRSGLVRTHYPVAAAARSRVLPNIQPVPALLTPDTLHHTKREWSTLSHEQKANILVRLVTDEESNPPCWQGQSSSSAAVSNVQQQQSGSQQALAHQHALPQRPQPGFQQQTQGFVNHPGFSNVTSAFPNVMQHGSGNTRAG